MLAIFPFFILGTALFRFIGDAENQLQLVSTVLRAMPPNVTAVIGPVARRAMEADSDWLLWVGTFVALWTASGLIESIRDILRRAYGEKQVHSYWLTRLSSAGVTLAAVVLMIVSLFVQIAIGTAEEMVADWSPELVESLAGLQLSRAFPALGLFISLYLLFLTLTPARFRVWRFAQWPGAAFTTLWWLGASSAMPPLVSKIVTHDLIYGSLAGIMLVLFFFWLVGLGLVMGVELNAALADPPDDAERLGRSNGAELDEENAA